MKILSKRNLMLLGGYIYLFYGLHTTGNAENWFELAKSLIVLAIAIGAFLAILAESENKE